MARTRAEVAKLLKKRRGGRSKAEVARAASVDRSYYYRLEKGEAGIGAKRAPDFARVLGGEPLDYISDPRERRLAGEKISGGVELDDPGPGAAAERVLILDRLRALEDQVGADSQDRDDAYRAVVARLADLEARLAQVERLSAPDGTASHAPREAHPK